MPHGTPPRIRSLAFLAALTFVAAAATAAPGSNPAREPASWAYANVAALDAVDVRLLPAVDVERLLAEDEADRDVTGIPYRVGQPMAVDLTPADSGTWEELPDGATLWRLRVRSEGAYWLVLGFGTFRPPPGARLYVYDAARRAVQGPFTTDDVRPHGQLWLAPVVGDTAVVELYWPAALRGVVPNVQLGTVSHGYKTVPGFDMGTLGVDTSPIDDEVETPDSGSCNIDVNCPLGDDWQDQKRAVVRLLSGGGSAYCTGSLVNNTANDCRPYVLTARHCLSTSSSAISTIFHFNYERPLCGSGAPTNSRTISGSTLVASYYPSDATLVELDEAPGEEFGAYYNGWSRATTPAAESWGIHHPSCDYKKISHNDDPLVNGVNYGSDHWRVTQWEEGTTEPCSSGSPMFDPDHRIVGQLHGGTASCTSITWDEYGKIDVSWTGGGTPTSRLSDALDPLGSGVVGLDGLDAMVCLNPLPELSYAGHDLQEQLGNGDGIADPGEALIVPVDLRNNGTTVATDVHATVTTPTGLAVIAPATCLWPDIPPAAEVTSKAPHVVVLLDPAFPCGEPIALRLDVEAAGYETAWIDEFIVQTGAVSEIDEHFVDDMESGAGTWSSAALFGTASWTLSAADAHGPAHSWFIPNEDSSEDTVLVMATVAALPADARLRFWHRFNTEANRDGGVLEYSIDGGTAWLDAKPLVLEGGYNTDVDPTEQSALAGRSVWSGDSGGWRQVTADLSSLAGSDLQLRWRFASNKFVADEGWYVDDVAVDTTHYGCTSLLAAPGEVSAPDTAAAPFRIDRGPDGYALSWSAPLDGGAAIGYRLYGMPLAAPEAGFGCEADLGPTTAATLAELSDDRAFVVVGANSLGEGSYGRSSEGADRPGAGAVCP